MPPSPDVRKCWIFILNCSFQAFITHQRLVSGIENDVQPLLIWVRKFNVYMHSCSEILRLQWRWFTELEVGRTDSEGVGSQGKQEKKFQLGLLSCPHGTSHLGRHFSIQSYWLFSKLECNAHKHRRQNQTDLPPGPHPPALTLLEYVLAKFLKTIIFSSVKWVNKSYPKRLSLW